MDLNEKPKLLQLVVVLCSTYRVKADPALHEGYWLGLRDLQLSDVEAAVQRAITSSKFMPVPAELREQSGALKPDDCAELAWNELRKAIQQYSHYDSVDFSDKAINATIRQLSGNWQQCCEEAVGEQFEVWYRKEFLRVYQTFTRIGVSAELGARHVGFCEQSNYNNGYDHDENYLVRIECETTKRLGLPCAFNELPAIEQKSAGLIAGPVAEPVEAVALSFALPDKPAPEMLSDTEFDRCRVEQQRLLRVWMGDSNRQPVPQPTGESR